MQDAVVYVGDRLKNLRTLNALTQAELAERAGLTTAAVARVERPSRDLLPFASSPKLLTYSHAT
jgi:transcriptional regulator with XRE-family HTH domain